MPAFKEAGFDRFVSVASASGLSARRMAERAGFEKAVSGADAVIDDPDVEVVVIATPHDSHARLAAQALRAGKHVFCEKPLALTMEELDDVEAAQRESGRVLFVGFNRRYSEPIRLVREHFAGGTGPLVITYRVNAGTVPAKHWYHDRRQGGRLLGEVCHFVDTCAAIVGSETAGVGVMSSGSREEVLLAQDLLVSLRYGDGSLATISYATGGHASTEKERIDIHGRGHSAVVLDFSSVHLDGRPSKCGPGSDKGHVAAIHTFRRAVMSGAILDDAAIRSTRATLRAASLLVGGD